MATHSGRDSCGWSRTHGNRTNTPELALPVPGASSRHWSLSEKSPYLRSGNHSMPIPSRVVPEVIDPSGFCANEPPPTCCHLAKDSAVPSRIVRYPSVWPGVPSPESRAAFWIASYSRWSSAPSLSSLSRTVFTCLRNSAWDVHSFSSSTNSPIRHRLLVTRLGTPESTVPTITVNRSSNSGQLGAGTPPPATTMRLTVRAAEVLPTLSLARYATVCAPTRSTTTGFVYVRYGP